MAKTAQCPALLGIKALIKDLVQRNLLQYVELALVDPGCIVYPVLPQASQQRAQGHDTYHMNMSSSVTHFLDQVKAL